MTKLKVINAEKTIPKIMDLDKSYIAGMVEGNYKDIVKDINILCNDLFSSDYSALILHKEISAKLSDDKIRTLLNLAATVSITQHNQIQAK